MGVFFPIPFIVVLLRLEIPAWTYYVWGALILGGGAILYVIDTAASTRGDVSRREFFPCANTSKKCPVRGLQLKGNNDR